MSKKIVFVLCLVLVIATACSVLAACESSSVTVTFMDGNTVYKTMEVKVGETFDLPKATKDNYTFVGWYTDANLEDIYVSDKLMTAITLYAKFIPNEMQVVINAKGGEISSRTVTVTNGQNYTLPVPTKEGYDFTGYIYYDENDQEQAFATSGVYNLDKSIRVEATWAVARYNVSFMVNGQAAAQYTVEHGTTVYAPNATKDGYDFTGWLDGTNANIGKKTSFVVTADAVYTAAFTPKTFRMTVENLSSANQAVEFGGTYSLPAEPTLPTGMKRFINYTVGDDVIEAEGTYTWTQDITVVANFERDPMYNRSKVTVYTADTTVTALDIDVENGSTITAELATLNTAKAGYNFVGWKTANGNEFVATTAITTDITIYANYTAKKLLVITSKSYAEDVQTYATYGETFVLSTPEARNGFKFLGYLRGTEAFDGSDLTVEDFDLLSLTITENWEQIANPDQEAGNDTLFIAYKADNYFKEREKTTDEFTYVFLTSQEYYLENIQAINGTANGGNNYMSWVKTAQGIDLTMKQEVGTFDLELTRAVDENTTYTYTRPVKVVNKVKMDYGTDYSNVWINQAQSGTDPNTGNGYNFQQPRKDGDVMAAGLNNFVFDISLTTPVGTDNEGHTIYNALSFADANIAVAVTVEGVATDDYTVDMAKGAITFGSSLLNQTVNVTVSPKYPTYTKNESGENVTYSYAYASFDLELNDGVNVYTNDELKANYALLSVHKINVLRNITAQMWDSDYDLRYPEGKKRTMAEVSLTEGGQATTRTMDIGTPINDYSHSVYARLTTDTTDRIEINGNFFAIDGSKLPYVDNRYTYRDFDGGFGGFDLANVQIGIFLYRNFYEDEFVHYRYQGGTLTINNLLVSGNNVALSDCTQDIGRTNKLLKMSAALNGLWCRGGTVNLNNVTFKKTNIAIATDSDVDGNDTGKQAVVINLTDCRLIENWGEDIYGYRITKFKIENTILGQATGGAAISFDEHPQPTATSGIGIELDMDAYTIANINNWVSGDEAWFIAYNQTGTAAQVKGGIQGALDQLKALGINLSIITKKTVQEQEVDYMNFAIYARGLGDNDGDNGWDSDPQHGTEIQFTGLTKLTGAMVNAYFGVDQTTAEEGLKKLAANGINIYISDDYQLYVIYAAGTGNKSQIVGLPAYFVAAE